MTCFKLRMDWILYFLRIIIHKDFQAQWESSTQIALEKNCKQKKHCLAVNSWVLLLQRWFSVSSPCITIIEIKWEKKNAPYFTAVITHWKIFISKNWTDIPEMFVGRIGYWFHINIYFDVFGPWWLKKISFPSFVHLFFFCGSYCVPCNTFTAKERSLAQSQAFLEHTVLFASALRSAAERDPLRKHSDIFTFFFNLY